MERRSFDFVFLFAPRSLKEAREVDDIIRAFKTYSHPKLEGNKRYQTFPAEFEISFWVGDTENGYLFRTSRLGLNNIEIDYSANPMGSFMAHEKDGENGAPPVMSSLRLTFTELEILHRDRILQGM